VRKTLYVAVAATVVFAAFAFWLLGGWSHGASVTVIDDVVLLVLAVPAAAMSAFAARSAHGRLRTAWVALTVGLTGWAIGEVIWTYYELVLHQSPFPSIADAFFLMLPAGACAALLLFPSQDSGHSRGRLFLDGVIVAGSLFLVSWVTVLGPVYEAGAPDRLGFVISLAYPISDVLILTVAAVVLVRAPADQRAVLTLLTVGLACIALADSSFTYLAATGQYESGNAIDMGWVAGFLFITVAAAAGREAAHDRHGVTGLPSWASMWLPYAPLLLAGIVAAAEPPKILQSGPVEAIGILLVAAVLGRQFLAVSENRRLLETVAEQARRDPLTGLANRILFDERLTHAMQLRERDVLTVGLVALDLDDFKLVNDTLGHHAGDQLLIGVAERLLGCVRIGDTVARLGGDEFAVLIEDRVDHSNVVARRIVESFAQPFVIDGEHVSVRPSVGLALAEPDEPGVSAEDLLKRADMAMYSAKRARTGAVHTFSPNMQPPSSNEKGMFQRHLPSLGELRQALEQFELTLVYQPKFDLRTSRIVGVEAMLRWTHPERGLLTPEEFLPLVRRHNLMGAVNDFVLSRALDDALAWHDASVAVPVAVNFSAPTLANLTLPAAIGRALSERGLGPAALTVEITEHQLLDNLERTQEVLKQLRDNGIRIAIDDFGSGYSTLSYLRDLAVDEVKLDRAFSAPILVDQRAAAVVRAVVELVHSLDLILVVEGVEDAETAARLRDYGCDLGQGYFYSPPVTSEELLALLATSATRSGPASARSS
jgi:diguanylate cyclase (GGDEF)-like protein